MNRFTTFFGFLLVFGMMNQPNAQAETTQNTLAEAWQQEYAYLAAERRELQARIGEQRTENAQQIADLENEILDLESEVSTAQSLREELTESVQLLQRATATDQDDVLVLESTLNQAAESIDRPIDENQTAANLSLIHI